MTMPGPIIAPTSFAAAAVLARPSRTDRRHSYLLRLAWATSVVALAVLTAYGASYYLLPLAARASSPLHEQLRPSGAIGIKLGFFGLGLFFLLFLYPIRKRWPWLSRIGNTRHWLDFHVLLGIVAPVVITLHSSLKFGGIAGVAYWIMAAVSLSGFIGRYLYAQVPRSVHAADLTLREMGDEHHRLAAQLETQSILASADLAILLRVPARDSVARMGLAAALASGLVMDLSRPFRVGHIRRRYISPVERLTTLGGLLRSSHPELEAAISAARAQAWLSAKLAFLTSTQRLFHLWHVVHRPFSMAFIILVALHITVALLFGYFR